MKLQCPGCEGTYFLLEENPWTGFLQYHCGDCDDWYDISECCQRESEEEEELCADTDFCTDCKFLQGVLEDVEE